MRPILAALALLALAPAPALGQVPPAPGPAPAAVPPPPPAPRPLVVPVVGAGGARLGSASFTEGPQGVLVRLELKAGALSPGWHGVHVHERGVCSDAGFKLSGAHVGHGPGAHGLLHPAGPEPGDLPNLYAPAKAPIAAEFFSSRLTLAPAPAPGRTPLLDSDGSALLIHAKPDDQLTQPIGGAGDRVACATLAR